MGMCWYSLRVTRTDNRSMPVLSDLKIEEGSTARAMKVVEDLRSHMYSLMFDISEDCDKRCMDELKPCALIKRLQELHKETDGQLLSFYESNKPIPFPGTGQADSIAQRLKFVEYMRGYRENIWWDLKQECDKRWLNGQVPCPLIEKIEDMHKEIGMKRVK